MLDFADLVLPPEKFDELQERFITGDLACPDITSCIFAISDAQIFANWLFVDDEPETFSWNHTHDGVGRRHNEGRARHNEEICLLQLGCLLEEPHQLQFMKVRARVFSWRIS